MAKENYEKYLGKSVYELLPKVPVKGRPPTMTVLSNNLVPGSNTYVEIG
jgi:hypothetical protein